VSRPARKLALTAATIALFAFAPAAASSDAPSDCADADLTPDASNLTQVESATLCLLNAERTSRGLEALRTDAQLRSAALTHSNDMVGHEYFAHEDQSGGGPEDRIYDAGYMPKYGPWVIGENIAWGTDYLSTPREIVRAWMNSTPHRKNILYTDFREIGIGVVLGVPDPTLGDGATYSSEFGAKAGELTQARRAHHARVHRAHKRGKRTHRRHHASGKKTAGRKCHGTPNPAVSFCGESISR
jgi:uncharacterized protein YkwD